MPANIDALIQEAQSALKTNRKADARRALDTALSIDEMSEIAWLLMSKVVDAESDQLTCLENVLAINPNNSQAQQQMAAIQGGAPPNPFAAPASPAVSPFQEPPDSDGWGDWARMDVPAPVSPSATPAKPSSASSIPSSVEWGSPADPSAADNRVIGQPSDADYDSWMAGLSLGGNSAGSKTSSDKRSGSAGLVPAFDTSDFDSGPFRATSFDPFDSDGDNSGPVNTDSASPFAGFSFDDPPEPAVAPTRQDSDPFGLRRGSSTPPPAAETGRLPEPRPMASSSPSPMPAAARPAEPFSTPFSMKGAEPPALAAARKRLDNEPTFDEYQSQLEAEAEEAKQTKGVSSRAPARNLPFATATDSSADEIPPSNAAIFTTIDSSPGMSNPSSYFSVIPDEIRNSTKVKPALVASLVGLVIVNLVSLILLLSNLAANSPRSIP